MELTIDAVGTQPLTIEGGAENSCVEHDKEQPTREVRVSPISATYNIVPNMKQMMNGSSNQDISNTPELPDSPEIENHHEGNDDGSPTQGTPLTQDIARAEGISTWDWAYGPPKPITSDNDYTIANGSAASVLDHASILRKSTEVPPAIEDESTYDIADSSCPNSNDASSVFSESADRDTHSRVVSDATTVFTLNCGSISSNSIRKISASTVDNEQGRIEQEAKPQVEDCSLLIVEDVSHPQEGQEPESEADVSSTDALEQLASNIEAEGSSSPIDPTSHVVSGAILGEVLEGSQQVQDDEEVTERDAGSFEVSADEDVSANDKEWEAAFASREKSFENDLEDLKDEHADELKHQKADLERQYEEEFAQLRDVLNAQHACELAQLREDVKTATKALQEQSGLLQTQNSIEVLYNELQERYARTVRNLEGQEEITQAKDQEVLQLRKRIYDATNDFDREKQQLQADNAQLKQEKDLVQMMLGRNKILFDECNNKLGELNLALEDDPRLRNVDQEQLLKYTEKQLADSTKQLQQVSAAFQELEHESKRERIEVEDRVANLENSLRLQNNETDFLSQRNKYLETYSEDVVARISRRMSQREMVGFLIDHFKQATIDRTFIFERLEAVQEQLLMSEAYVLLWKGKHRELSDKCSNNEEVLGKLEEENRALVGKNDSQGFSIDGKEKEIKDLAAAKAHGEAWRDREIERLSNMFDTIGRFDASHQTRWALDHKDSVIKQLEADLKVTQSQLGQLQKKMAEVEWSVGNDQVLAGYSNYLDEKRQERLEEAEAELEELRAANPGYSFWLRQEAIGHKEQLKASEENVINLEEQLKKLQEKYNSFSEAAKVRVMSIRGEASQVEDQLQVRNEKLRNLGYRIYTRMMRFEAISQAKNEVVADDTWDALMAECVELFSDSEDKHEKEIYDADGFLHESQEKNKHESQGGLIPRPLFSKENTPEEQDAHATEGKNSGSEDISNHQDNENSINRLDDTEPANQKMPRNFAKVGLLSRLTALEVSKESSGNRDEDPRATSKTNTIATTKHLEQASSSFASNAATTGDHSFVSSKFEHPDEENADEETVRDEASNVTVVRRLGNVENKARSGVTCADGQIGVIEGQAAEGRKACHVSLIPDCQETKATEYHKAANNSLSKACTDKMDGPGTSNHDEDSYDLSEEELKILNDTGRFPDRFALPSTQIEEQERFLYDGSDDEGEAGEEGNYQGEDEQDEDEKEGDDMMT